MTSRARCARQLLLALALLASGCARAPNQWEYPLFAAETARQSRVAAVVRYDVAYVERLHRWVAALRKWENEPALGDPVSLAFALDELAEVYTYRLVHFERAAAVNREAAETLARWRGQGAPKRVGWYFSRHRTLYPFVIGPMDEIVKTVQGWPGRWPRYHHHAEMRWTGAAWSNEPSPLHTVFPDDFLTRIWDDDLARLEARIAARERVLRRAAGGSSPPAPDPPGASSDQSLRELSEWADLLGDVAQPQRAALLLDRAWALRPESPPALLAPVVHRLAQEVLDAGGPVPVPSGPQLVARLRRVSALLDLGRDGDAVAEADETFAMLQVHAEHQHELVKEVRGSVWKAAGIGAVAAAIWAGAVAASFATGGLPLDMLVRSLGDLTRLQFALTQLFELDRLRGILRDRPPLAPFLDEEERLHFHFALGQAYERAGRSAEAAAQYRQGIEIIERQRSTIPTEPGRIRYFRDKQRVYAALIRLLVRSDAWEDAFHHSERSRARSLLDIIGSGHIRFGSAAEAMEYEISEREQAEIEILVREGGLDRATAAAIHSLGRGGRATEEPGGAPPTGVTGPEFGGLVAVQVASLAEIAAAVGDQAALLSFFVTEDETILFLVQDGRLSVRVRPLPRAALVSMIGRVHALVRARPDEDSARERRQHMLDELGATLHAHLLEPVLPHLTKRFLYVAPHGPLHYLPFGLLRSRTAGSAPPPILARVPSATLLTHLARKARGRGGTLVVANPDIGHRGGDLPHAAQEGLEITRHRRDAVLLTGPEASETSVKRLAANNEILHFAAHAWLDVETPLDSAVLLAAGDGEDGRLTAGELFALRLAGTVVVLSGCETALGHLASGDELLGITRALVYAGAPVIVATLWPIDDESASVLMKEFYARLEKHPVAEALHLAQLAVRHRYPDPFHWAGFTVSGHLR